MGDAGSGVLVPAHRTLAPGILPSARSEETSLSPSGLRSVSYAARLARATPSSPSRDRQSLKHEGNGFFLKERLLFGEELAAEPLEAAGGAEPVQKLVDLPLQRVVTAAEAHRPAFLA